MYFSVSSTVTKIFVRYSSSIQKLQNWLHLKLNSKIFQYSGCLHGFYSFVFSKNSPKYRISRFFSLNKADSGPNFEYFYLILEKSFLCDSFFCKKVKESSLRIKYSLYHDPDITYSKIRLNKLYPVSKADFKSNFEKFYIILEKSFCCDSSSYRNLQESSFR